MSLANPALRVIQQKRNMVGKELIGIYATYRQFRAAIELAQLTPMSSKKHSLSKFILNGNKASTSIESRELTMARIRNFYNEYVSDNIAEFSGA